MQPIKLFNASAEVLYEPIKEGGPDCREESLTYLHSALKCELVIEKTISDIFRIRNKDEKLFMICDNNCLDLQTASDPEVWDAFLKKSQVPLR
jgi:hypothetical protein